MIHSLLDCVSKNCNMLLNISPTTAGIVPQEQQQVLHDIGAYLDRYGESVYSTRAWDIYGEGPNRAGGGSFTAPLLGNSSDIRYTRSKDNRVLYATMLGWPSSRSVRLESFGWNRGVNLSDLNSIQLLGNQAGQYGNAPRWQQQADGLQISHPSQPSQSVAYVLKLTFYGNMPVPQLLKGASIFPGKGVSGRGIALGESEFTSDYLIDAGLAPGSVGFLRVSSGTTVTVYVGRNFTGDATDYKSGEHQITAGTVGSISIASG